MRIGTLLLLAACAGAPSGEDECLEEQKILVYADADKDGFGAPDTQKPVCPPLDDQGRPTGRIPRGFSANDKDCDDDRSDVNPGAIEQCNGLDDDCDVDADEGLRELLFFLDGDGDTFGNPVGDLGVVACSAPAGFVDNALDCEDDDSTIHPDATEVCDGGIDNDCDGRADDEDPTLDRATAPLWYLDSDGDSFGDSAVFEQVCLAPSPRHVANSDDCDDLDVDVNPNAVEVCNRFDDDCDQHIDDSDSDIDPSTQTTWYEDADGDGTGTDAVTEVACWQPWFFVDNTDDCDDTNPLLGLPAPWLLDSDSDGFGAGTPSAPSCTAPTGDHVLLVIGFDCDDTEQFVNPLGNEVCDGDDNDCDTLVDGDDDSLDATTANEYFRDADRDTFGDEDDSVFACTRPAGYLVDDTDCDDTNDLINPDGNEVCDGVDNDCDRAVDDQDTSVDPSSALTWYADFDADSWGDVGQSTVSCVEPQFYDADPGDCDDTDPDAYPAAPEVCGDGIDQDCSGADMSCFAPTGRFRGGASPALLGMPTEDLR